jgi:glucose-1-phosphate thymidylyltransferase
MKIIGPIAGIGSRLRPFTFSKPKAFINVAGETVLDHILKKFFNSFDKDTELILIVGYKKRQIIDYVNQKYADKFDIIFIEQEPRGYQDNIPYYWGLGEAVYLSHERFKKLEGLNPDEDRREGALIFLGDMIPLEEYSYLMNKYYESDLDGIITVMEVSKEDASSYGIVAVDENNIIQKLVEKPKEYISNLAIAGIYVFSHTTTLALFNKLRKYLDKRTEESKEIYITESLQDLVIDGFRIAAVTLKEGIIDFGRPSELLHGNQRLLEEKSINEEDFQQLNISVETSMLKNPIYIGRGTKIINSVIGPYVSIGEDSYIENSIIENSLIEKNSSLKNIITSNSIIGSNVKVQDISKDNLIIGDKSAF